MQPRETTFERREVRTEGPGGTSSVSEKTKAFPAVVAPGTSSSAGSMGAMPAKMEQLKTQGTQAFDRLRSSFPASAQDVWNSLPAMWQYTLFSDAFIFWPLLGGTLLFAPMKALDMHRRMANYFGWAGPTPSVASNALIMNVQALGAVCLSLHILAAYGWYRRDVYFARIYSVFRLALGCFLLYAVYFSHPGMAMVKGPSTFKALIPFALHSLWHAGAIISSGPQAWTRMFSRLPAAFTESTQHQHAA